jgi:hypothetical protein
MAKRILARTATVIAACGALSSCFVGIVLNDDEVNVLIYESSGKRQCEPVALTPQQSASRLKNAGVDVRESSCAVLTSIAFPAVCGAPSGELVVHEISESKLDAAQRLGFTLVTTLRLGTGEPGYVAVACTSTSP